MDDRYPSTDEHPAVHLHFPYPDARSDLNRWLPRVKWLLAIPHYPGDRGGFGRRAPDTLSETSEREAA